MDINSIGSVSSIASLATDMSTQRLQDQIATTMQQKANAQIGGTTLQLLSATVATTEQAQQVQKSNSNPPHLGQNVDVLV